MRIHVWNTPALFKATSLAARRVAALSDQETPKRPPPINATPPIRNALRLTPIVRLLGSGGSLAGGSQDGFADTRIGTAAADIGHRLVDVRRGRPAGFFY